MKRKVHIIKLHSFIDVITNSSTELFVVDKTKIEGQMKDMFEFLLDTHIDEETEIRTWEDYPYTDDYILPEGIDSKECYVIDASYHNTLLTELIKKYFNPIDYSYKED